MIDRYLLRYLLAVVDKGNFSRAAEHCGVSQPTLSVGIAKLEAEVGRTLFLRTNRRVELTGAGTRLVDRARRIEREFTLAEQEARVSKFRTTIRLGVISTLPADWLGTAAAAVAAGGSEERLEIVEGNERAMLSHLDRGRVDVILSLIRPDRAKFARALFHEPYRLVLARDHPLGRRDVIHAEEVADSAMVVRRHCEALQETSRYFTSRGVRPFISARTTSDAQALALVRGGHGLTVMPAGFHAPSVRMVALSGFEADRTIGLIYDRAPSERPSSKALDIIADGLTSAALKQSDQSE
ncbi:LysR family transcriptional regulator [Sphingomonas sp. BIUV-7]|uniref:LysR family transcriptional regulator n=1 Tax=Sphingomonas natans TaxID=3063330 RepID=A0ABT8Y9D4_9SPHN|nr:LysR family transcriptional regulator [Sphingomonas sp. BIUV-7]MDO6414946.1 LysR family transcriptional regulator [Sphingomonas sp. BIUV-7]